MKLAGFSFFIVTPEMNGQADIEVDYKRKYKNLKRKLKFLVYVSKCPSFCDALIFAVCSFGADFVFAFVFKGTGMFSRGAKESTEKTSQSFQRQKVRLTSTTVCML